MTKPIAIIPARGGSKRIPRKNIADMNGTPMIGYPIKSALESGIFSDVIVSTEDAEIGEIAKSLGAHVVPRPPELATDTAMELQVYAQVLAVIDARPTHFCGIYPTAIFIESGDFEKSYDVIKADADLDVLMGVSRFAIHPYKALEESADGYLAMVHPKECPQRSQTYPHYVASNGTFYWFKTDSYLKHKSYYPPKLKGYVLPQNKAVDIDEPDDLQIARALLSLRK